MTSAGELDTDFAMPLAEAMSTQRAIRRLRSDPVDDDVVLRCIELATRAPTGSNRQGWEFVVVRDPEVKHQLARLNRQAWSVYRRLGAKRARREASMGKIVDAVQWQADHFEEVPVVVVPCLHGRAPVFGSPVIAASYYGSIFPAVQNLLLAARAVGLGATLTTLARLVGHAGAPYPGATGIDLPGGSGPHGVAAGWLRSHHPPTGGRSGTRRPLWPSTVLPEHHAPRLRLRQNRRVPDGAGQRWCGVLALEGRCHAEKRTSSPLPRGSRAETGIRRRPLRRGQPHVGGRRPRRQGRRRGRGRDDDDDAWADEWDDDPLDDDDPLREDDRRAAS